MPGRRRRRGFTAAAELPPAEMGLPAARARELLLTRAWREVAGEAVARRAPAIAVRRGVVEIALPAEAWGRELVVLLPTLAARLAAHEPALGISRFRLVPQDGGPKEAARALPPFAGDAAPSRAGIAARRPLPATPPAPADPSLDERLQRAMTDYLGRGGRARDHNA